MKKTIFAAAIILLIYSCGSSRNIERYERDAVTMGYDTISGDVNSFAVSVVKPDKDKASTSYTNMYSYLQGRVPGLYVSGTDIVIRGVGSNTNTAPLILVDGIEMDDISAIDPYYVSSVEVLKDASASMYGIRGANGVILITTRKK